MQRMTRQRQDVWREVNANLDFRSAQRVYRDLIKNGSQIGLTTVYRSLQAMADEGLLDTVRSNDGEILFRKCRQKTHHHHLVCRICGATVEVELVRIESLIEKEAAKHGYITPTHSVEIYGICPVCQSGASA